MFRNVLDQYVRKAFDYLKIEEGKAKNNSSESNLTDTTDLNNKTESANRRHRFGERSSHLSLVDEYDWFRPLQRAYKNDVDTERQQQALKFDSYYDFLSKFYYVTMNGTNNGMINLNGGGGDLLIEPMMNNLSLNGGGGEVGGLIDSSSYSLKAVKLFQKSYYKEHIRGEQINVPSWRMKEKMKTVSAALVMCLNIGVDPPDIVKITQCSKLECWINQMLFAPPKALEMIGAELQKQYERWQPRARYKHCLDPTTDEVKKLCISLRKNAKEDRVLFHYNGHGVPRPTINGEIWVFNKEFTQYIPLSLYEVQTWMGTPSLYVWDCSNAGLIIQSFLQFEEDRENEFLQRNETLTNGSSSASGIGPGRTSQSMPKIRDSIHLAACSANELLPMHADLPFDLFTACLTTPIKAALHWYVSQKNSCQLIPGLTVDLLEKIPGQINDRRTMLGELNWIFTAITDTIAWNSLDTELFQKLFRQDLLVASLFRNFLLAERIMKSLDCTPVSHPALPPTNEHPLWQSWDLALDMCISQLPHIINGNGEQKDFQSCGFFTEQIEIFDVWLKYNVNSNNSPEQLPVVLQVLLSQQHRLKALELLAKFIDMGPWAVSAALSVGIFPYVLKLLSTQPKELRSLLTFIWAKILAVDKSCQAELVKDNGHAYFIHILPESDVPSIQKVYSAFVLACLVDNYPTGQESAKQNHLIGICSYLLDDKVSSDYGNPLLRQWICICLGLSWQNYPEARCEGSRCNAHQSLMNLINDPVAEVRAAAIFALGTYVGCGQGQEETLELKNKIDSEIISALIKEYDMVFLVRKELIAALFNYINQFITQLNGMTATTPDFLFKHSNDSAMSSDSSLLRSATLLSSSSTIPKSHSASSLVATKAPPSATIGATQDNALGQITENKLFTINSSSSSASNSQKSSLSATPGSTLVHSVSINNNLAHSTSSDYFSTPTSNSNHHHNNHPQAASSSSSSSRSNGNGSLLYSTPTQQQIPSILANNSVNNLFIRVWNLLIDMQSDPYPDVAELAQRVFQYFLKQIHLFDLTKQKLMLDAIKSKQSKLVNNINGELNRALQILNTNINTEFVPWCCKYFLRPLLSVTSSSCDIYSRASTNGDSNNLLMLNSNKQDVYSSDFLDQHCKLIYNYKKRKIPGEWHEPRVMDEVMQIKHNSYPLHIKFHPNEEQIFVADRDCYISIYETNQRTKLLSFPVVNSRLLANGIRKPSLITSFKLVNTQHEPILLVGTDDYVVRFFKPQKSANNLLTAFAAVNDSSRKQSTKESGLIVEWNEQREILLCGGDTSSIRVWDMSKELYKEYSTEVNSCITSLTTNENYTIAGFGDGSVRMFDFRAPSSLSLMSSYYAIESNSSMPPSNRRTISTGLVGAACVSSNGGGSTSASSQSISSFHYKPSLIYQHESFILKVKLHKANNKLVSSGIFGGINVFDMRMMKNDVELAFNKEYATALECHPVNELIAVGNGSEQNQTIKIFDFKGKELSCIKHHDGFIGKRISTVTCLDWNSYKNEIVFASSDYCLTVFSCKDTL